MRKYLQRNLIAAPIAVSSTTTYTSQWQVMDSFQSYGIQVVWTGTPTASVSLEVSMDPIPSLETFATASAEAPTNSDTVAGSTVAASGINIITYDNIETSANWVRVKWINASGTGTITSVNLVAKGSQT